MREIRYRSMEEIMEEIREKARSYTPEWRFDQNDPDIGVALSQVYAGIQNGLDRKYALLPEKFRIDYFNCLNTSMKASAPAEGYAVFGLSGEDAEGSTLTAGTALRTDRTDEQGEMVPAELSEDLYVIPESLDAIYETQGGKDYIGLLYASDMEETRGFRLFGMSGENLERHVFYLSHPWLFRISRQGSIVLGLYGQNGELLPEQILSRFTDPGAVRFFYETGEETVEYLKHVSVEGGLLKIRKSAEQPLMEESEHGGVRSLWLGCEITDIRGLENFSPDRITIAAECAAVYPDSIYAAGADQAVGEPVFAFGERFAQYDELYIGAGDALSKKGARIELSFEEEFARIPIEGVEEAGIDWKLVMPKDQFKQEKQYDITIGEVIWEYYNGSGWARLFPANDYRDAFSPLRGTGRQLKKISFTCPEDLEPVLSGSGENYYIRARVRKVENEFRTSGQFLSPVISGMTVSYRYPDGGREPEFLFCENHLEAELLNPKRERQAGRTLQPVKPAVDTRPALYLGFRAPWTEGPVRLLWVLGQTLEASQPELRWEYLGRDGFESLRPEDGTENFRKTGHITFSGIPEAKRTMLFGRELYWIRAVRTGQGGSLKDCPEIRAWYLNAAKIITLRRGLTEYWTIENWEQGAEIRLMNRNIHSLELWVREEERLPEKEAEALRAEGRIEEVLDESGRRLFAWVLWKQTDSLRRHGPSDRVYLLDENEGVITFGGGARGRVPAPGVTDGVRVRYSTGGGKISSLPAGSVNGLELTEGFVNTVFNPMPLFGAYDRETARRAMRRAAAEQKNRFRAVTEDDFEELAKGYFGNIRKARCFSGINAAGVEESGAVTLALLTEEYLDQGAGFEELRKRLYKYFSDKLPAGLKCGEGFRIREPELAELSLHIEAVIRDYQNLYRIQSALQEKLRQYLDPLGEDSEGREGWEIGMLPDQASLETLVRSTEGIEQLVRLVVTVRLLKKPGMPQAVFEEIGNHPFVLPVNGRHSIRLRLSGI